MSFPSRSAFENASRPSPPSLSGKAIALIVFFGVCLLFGSIVFAMSSEKVAAGTVAVVTRNGADVGVADPGRVWLTPAIESLTVYETSVQYLEFTGVDSDSDYSDTVITQKSKDGVNANYAAMLSFSIDPTQVREIYRTRGRSMDNLVNQNVQVITRDAARDIIEQGMMDDIYLGGMERYSASVETELTTRLGEFGVIVHDFNFTAIDPSDNYKASIEQQAEQQQQAKLEAERVEVERQKAEQKRQQAQGDADAEVIRAQGEADANRILAESLTEDILLMEYYRVLGTVTWAILDSPEGAMPTLPIDTPTEEPTETEG